jgi:hypothetical protein
MEIKSEMRKTIRTTTRILYTVAWRYGKKFHTLFTNLSSRRKSAFFYNLFLQFSGPPKCENVFLLQMKFRVGESSIGLVKENERVQKETRGK